MILDTLKNLFQGVYNARIEKRLQLALIKDIDQDFEHITGATINRNESIQFGECTLFNVWGFVSDRINKFNYTYNQLIGEIEAENLEQYHRLKIISYNDYLSCRAYNPPQHLQNYFKENPQFKAIIGHNLSNEPYQDYAKMIKDFYPKFGSFFLKKYPFNIKDQDRERHTYIIGASGNGKSELLKYIIHEQATRKDKKSSLVLIDPHGDLAEEISQFKDLDQSRLVIFDPTLFKGFTPKFNPFDIDTTDPQSIEVATSQFIKTFKDTIKGGDSVSSNMEVFLNPIISTLLRIKGADFRDFRDFLDEETNAQLIEFGGQTSNEGHRIFFEKYINDKSYKVSREALLKKVQELLNSQTFVNITTGESTVKLSNLINENYIIIFNLSKQNLGEDISSIIGRLIIAQIQAIAMRRKRNNRPTTHVFIDEFQNYVSDSIKTVLTEARKYGLHFTLAQQNRGQEMNSQIEDIVLGNTKIKIQGLIDDNVKGVINDSDNVKLNTGEFLIKITGKEKVKITVPQTYLGTKNSLKNDDYNQLLKQQKKIYYKPIHRKNSKETGQSENSYKAKYDL